MRGSTAAESPRGTGNYRALESRAAEQRLVRMGAVDTFVGFVDHTGEA